ncbi:hypothetical protein TNCT_81401 [Trichonephila clavata]|uniref:Uncharacterized protein n=1 Tax=Trichonephila clavata TaxID=2740835 RepID=A0A8X6HDL2_TRICU|nr:hypothetical protein TNCT_81401 [Trichonephila clavata]
MDYDFTLDSSTLKVLTRKVTTQDGFFIQKNYSTVKEVLVHVEKLSTSHLAPWQKFDTQILLLLPVFVFCHEHGPAGHKTSWHKVDNIGIREVKNISLAPKASNQYLSMNRKLGRCGATFAAEDSDNYLIDSAFKLRTFKGKEVVSYRISASCLLWFAKG